MKLWRRTKPLTIAVDLDGLGRLIHDLFGDDDGPVHEYLVGERLRITRSLSRRLVVHLTRTQVAWLHAKRSEQPDRDLVRAYGTGGGEPGE